MKKNINLSKLVTSAGLSLALTVNIAANAQQAPTSNNLPVPNYVNGANLTYYLTTTSVNANAGQLSASAQQNCASAANESNMLDINLGGIQGNVADLRYNSYNVGRDSSVNYTFGAANQVAINRVDVGAPISQIQGSITQTGQNGAVFLINPNGIMFGPESSVWVDSFMVSTLNYASDTLQNPGNKTLTLARNTSPAGIILQKANASYNNIRTGNNAIFVSNAIMNYGKDIIGKGNVQLITADGVTFHFDENMKALPIDPKDPSQITASSVKPSDVFAGQTSAIYQKDSTISGNQVQMIAMLNAESSSPFDNLINMQGIVTAKGIRTAGNGTSLVYISTYTPDDPEEAEEYTPPVDNSPTVSTAGDLFIYAQNINQTARAGVKLGKLTAEDIDGQQGNTVIAADNIAFNTGGMIKSSNLTLEQATNGKAINLGSIVDPNSLNINNTLLSKIDTKKLTIGNGSHANITGDNVDLAVNSTAPIYLALNTSGNINLKFSSLNKINTINTAIPAENVELSAVPGISLKPGNIESTGEIRLTADSLTLQDSSHLTGNSLTLVKATPTRDFTAPEIQSIANISDLTDSLILGDQNYSGNIMGNGLDLHNLNLTFSTSGNINLAGLTNTGLLSTNRGAASISLGGNISEISNLSSMGSILINHTSSENGMNITGNIQTLANVNISSIGDVGISGQINAYGNNNTVNISARRLNASDGIINAPVLITNTTGTSSLHVNNVNDIRIQNASGLNIRGDNNLNITSLQASGDYNILAANIVTIHPGISTDGNINITGREINVNNLEADGDVNVTGIRITTNNITSGKSTFLAGVDPANPSVIIGDVATGSITAGEDVTIKGKNISHGQILAGGRISLISSNTDGSGDDNGNDNGNNDGGDNTGGNNGGNNGDNNGNGDTGNNTGNNNGGSIITTPDLSNNINPSFKYDSVNKAASAMYVNPSADYQAYGSILPPSGEDILNMQVIGLASAIPDEESIIGESISSKKKKKNKK